MFKRIKNLLRLSKYHITPISIKCPRCHETLAQTGVLCGEKGGGLYGDTVVSHLGGFIQTIDFCDRCKIETGVGVVYNKIP